MARNVNEYSQTTDVSSSSEYSEYSPEVPTCSTDESPRTTFHHRSRNPFRISYLNGLRYPICSPSLFESIEKAIAPPSEEIETLCDIDESDICCDETLDSETEKTAQEIISKFFEDESQDLFVTPDKITNSFLICPGKVKGDEDISLSYFCDPSTIQHDINLSTTWAQTNITFPPNLPEEIETALTLHRQQNENERKLATCRLCDTVCGKHSQCNHTDECGINVENISKTSVESVKKVAGCSQTLLSFSKELPEALLSPYETFFEEMYTDIRMSMMKRQLFSEHYASSPQFHSSSPLSMLNDTSPLQSGSSLTPRCESVKLRHFGSPMGDILSPMGVSPIMKPSKPNRFLSKLDFAHSHLETTHAMSPPIFLQVKGAIFPSAEDKSHQRN